MINFHFSFKTGLGNRINSLVSLFRIQKYNSFEFGIHWNGKLWPQKGLLPCEFNELFANDIKQVDIKDTTMVATRLLHTFPGEPQVDAAYEKTPENIKQDYIECFAKLIPSENIQKKVKAELDSIGGPFLSLHIRTGEDWKPSSLEAYFERFKELEKLPIYVVTHSPNILMDVFEKFGHRVRCQNTKNYFSLPDILVDMLVLSHGKELICDWKSSFPCCAWYFGGAKAKVHKVS